MRLFILFLMFGIGLAADAPLPTRLDLLAAQQKFETPETRVDGLRQLILISGNQLFVVGGVVLVTSDLEVDDIQRQAARIVKANRQPDLIRPLFDDPERLVRLWAVIGCVTTHGQQEPWQPLIPLLIKAATQDPDGSVRSRAVERVRSYGRQADLEEAIPKESSPQVLMHLYDFSRGEAQRKLWYARALKELDGDAATRHLWLQSIAGGALNPSTAPMWRIDPDPELIVTLERIAKSGEAENSPLARQIINHFQNAPADRQP